MGVATLLDSESWTFSISVLRVTVIKEWRQLRTKTSTQMHTLTRRCIVQTLLEGANPLSNQHKQSTWAKLHCSDYTHAMTVSEELLLSTCTCDRTGQSACLEVCACVRKKNYLSCMSIVFAWNLYQAWFSLIKTIKKKKKRHQYLQPTARQRGQWDKGEI